MRERMFTKEFTDENLKASRRFAEKYSLPIHPNCRCEWVYNHFNLFKDNQEKFEELCKYGKSKERTKDIIYSWLIPNSKSFNDLFSFLKQKVIKDEINPEYTDQNKF